MRAWLHFYLKDHHLLRIWWWNLEEFAPGMWRSNQPSPGRLKRHKAMGIENIVSLRKVTPQSPDLFEVEACAQLGLRFHRVEGVAARQLKPAETILKALDAISQVPKPLVIHCKSGADRSGFVAALYLVLVEGRSVAEAAGQLGVKYVHLPRSNAGTLGHVFRVYLRDVEPTGMEFREWFEKQYDPEFVTADFQDWRKGVGRWAT